MVWQILKEIKFGLSKKKNRTLTRVRPSLLSGRSTGIDAVSYTFYKIRILITVPFGNFLKTQISIINLAVLSFL